MLDCRFPAERADERMLGKKYFSKNVLRETGWGQGSARHLGIVQLNSRAMHLANLFIRLLLKNGSTNG